jgi:Phosphopantothenate-cysteine ligase (EC 6.3.2.5)/Phosphopantothenoylcysteine decarboxylase (EC 4.1.1.36)
MSVMNDYDRGFHPTLSIKGTKSKSLLGKKIVVGVTGSVAAVRVVELCRELIRYGADVYVVMTDAAKNIIHPYTLHYASGHDVIERLVGRIEHVEFLGMEGRPIYF